MIRKLTYVTKDYYPSCNVFLNKEIGMFTKIKDVSQECADNIFCSVNTIGDIDTASDLEKKHLPIITAPNSVKKGERFAVTIEVGKLLKHPNEPGHFIQFVELYADDTYLTRVDFTPQFTEPYIKTFLAR